MEESDKFEDDDLDFEEDFYDEDGEKYYFYYQEQNTDKNDEDLKNFRRYMVD